MKEAALNADIHELMVQTSPEWRFYNPSISKVAKNQFLLLFRESNYNFCTQSLSLDERNYLLKMIPYFNSYIWAAIVGPTYFKSKNIPLTKLKIDDSFASVSKANGLEDPRTFAGVQCMYILASYRTRRFQARQALIKLSATGKTTVVQLTAFEKDEKNWLIFREEKEKNSSRYRLLATYTQFPHTIVSIDTKTGLVSKLYSTPSPSALKDARGSCNPVLIKDEYLAMAHFRRRHFYYTHIFYKFQKDPPFSVTAVSSSFIIDKNRKGPIEFALSMIVIGKDLHITYGDQDCWSKVAIISLEKVNKLFRS